MKKDLILWITFALIISLAVSLSPVPVTGFTNCQPSSSSSGG